MSEITAFLLYHRVLVISMITPVYLLLQLPSLLRNLDVKTLMGSTSLCPVSEAFDPL